MALAYVRAMHRYGSLSLLCRSSCRVSETGTAWRCYDVNFTQFIAITINSSSMPLHHPLFKLLADPHGCSVLLGLLWTLMRSSRRIFPLSLASNESRYTARFFLHVTTSHMDWLSCNSSHNLVKRFSPFLLTLPASVTLCTQRAGTL